MIILSPPLSKGIAMADKSQERVLVVPTAVFHDAGLFQGFSPEVDHYLPRLLDPVRLSYRPRAEVEPDPSFKQIIPYAVIAFQNSVLHYVRGKKAGEQRLVAKGSIGIGGHMAEDADRFLWHSTDEETYRAGVEREVNEEIKIDTPFEDRIVALLNDDSTEVGRVHLGIVHVFKLKEPQVQKREAMITGLTFLAKDELFARRETMETWLQICLDSLDRLLL